MINKVYKFSQDKASLSLEKVKSTGYTATYFLSVCFLNLTKKGYKR